MPGTWSLLGLKPIMVQSHLTTYLDHLVLTLLFINQYNSFGLSYLQFQLLGSGV